MCGIVTIFNREKPVPSVEVLNQYLDQRSRGIDGYGFAYLTGDGKVFYQRFAHEAECFFALSRIQSKCIMFHHRHPTSTKNTPLQNHPIPLFSKKSTYVMVHNGVISNANTLRHEEHKHRHYSTELDAGTQAYSYKTFNDSESLLHELVQYHEGDVDALRSKGSVAFVMLECDRGTGELRNIHFGRNTMNPLYHAFSEETGTHTLASNILSMPTTDQLKENQWYTYEWATGNLTQKDCDIPETARYVYKPKGTFVAKASSEWPKWEKGKYAKKEEINYEEEGLFPLVYSDYVDILKIADEFIDWAIKNNIEKETVIRKSLILVDIEDLIIDVYNHSIAGYGLLTKGAKEKILALNDDVRSKILPDVIHMWSVKNRQQTIEDLLGAVNNPADQKSLLPAAK